MLKSVNNISAKQILLGGDFNFYLDSLLESLDENPTLKNLLPKCLSLKMPLDFTISGGLEIPKSKDLLFDKITGPVLFNVHWTFFVSDVLQDSVHETDFLALFCSDHSPILFSLDMIKEG